MEKSKQKTADTALSYSFRLLIGLANNSLELFGVTLSETIGVSRSAQVAVIDASGHRSDLRSVLVGVTSRVNCFLGLMSGRYASAMTRRAWSLAAVKASRLDSHLHSVLKGGCNLRPHLALDLEHADSALHRQLPRQRLQR